MKKGLIIAIVFAVICLILIMVWFQLSKTNFPTTIDVISTEDISRSALQSNIETNSPVNSQDEIIKTLTFKISGLDKTLKIYFTDEQYEDYQKNGLFSKIDRTKMDSKEDILKYLENTYNVEEIK